MQKILMSVWWNLQCVLHYEYVQQGRAINAKLYFQQLDRVYDKLMKEYPTLLNRGRPLIQEDIERQQNARLTQKFKHMEGVEILPHPRFSPNAYLRDYGLCHLMVHFLLQHF